MASNVLIHKLWNYCNVLRDDGMSYGDYVAQLTYLLFLKVADERSRPPTASPALSPPPTPGPYCWPMTARRCSITTVTHWKGWASSPARWR